MTSISSAFKPEEKARKSANGWGLAFPVLSLFLISYLLVNTGIISDDFVAMARLKGENLINILIPKGAFYFIETPVEYFTHYIWYCLFKIDNSALLNAFKIAYISLSFYLISRFFMLYMERRNAFLVSLLFIFFPSHDSTVYSFMLQYLTLSFAFYLYAFYLAHKNRFMLAFLFALFASFISYGSPAIAVALSLLFILNKQFRKALVVALPNIIYMAYYIWLSKVMAAGTDKTSMGGPLDIAALMKHFSLEILTFMDAMIGPSMWLKLYYSFFQLSAISFISGAILTAVFYKTYHSGKKTYDKRLIISFSVLLLTSLAMFALTGHYPQLAFNLGNRVTIFGSLLFSYLIVLLPGSRGVKTLIFAILIFSTFGISDHWKDWNIQQEKVITNIRNNQEILSYQGKETIYVSGNQYSQYGPVSHIEFMSENWVPACIFRILFDKRIDAAAINTRHKYVNGYLIDTKYNLKTKIGNYIMVYDSEKDRLLRLNSDDINSYIDSLPPNYRHWVQLIPAKFAKKTATFLMPRLKYALP